MSNLYTIQYSSEAADDVRSLRVFDQRKVLEGIETHLSHQPNKSSKTRVKAMVQPFWSQFRLRIEDFRVYYDVDEVMHQVNVLRVLEKKSETTPEKPP